MRRVLFLLLAVPAMASAQEIEKAPPQQWEAAADGLSRIR